MKKYFRKHIIQEGEKFYIRKRHFLLGWLYLDREEKIPYWWTPTYIRHASFNTLEDARKKLSSIKTKKKIYYK